MTGELLAAAFGFGMGFFGSVPLTGPIALFVFHRALQERYGRGMAVGVGGAVGELIYCAMAVAGVGALVEQYPMAAAGLKTVSALVLVAFGLFFLITPPSQTGQTAEDEELEFAADTWMKDFMQGFTISAFNPILLLNWTAAVAILYSLAGIRLDFAAGVIFTIAATVGVSVWFVVLVLILRYFKRQIPERTVAWIQRGMGAIVLVAAALPFHDVLSSLA
jgi:threonine/homoserine/homoserine lactone efflux protein